MRDPRGQRIDIGLLSRDITGKSTKFQLVEATQRFFDTLYQSPDLRWMHTHSAGTHRPVYPPLFARGLTITTSSGASARTEIFLDNLARWRDGRPVRNGARPGTD